MIMLVGNTSRTCHVGEPTGELSPRRHDRCDRPERDKDWSRQGRLVPPFERLPGTDGAALHRAAGRPGRAPAVAAPRSCRDLSRWRATRCRLIADRSGGHETTGRNASPGYREQPTQVRRSDSVRRRRRAIGQPRARRVRITVQSRQPLTQPRKLRLADHGPPASHRQVRSCRACPCARHGRTATAGLTGRSCLSRGYSGRRRSAPWASRRPSGSTQIRRAGS
ncbi:MAG: hypothetical protein QOE97_3117 [Pseudonocardiales bacterium]|nr:hypothetical protein [Pseudonocardiales bacterium]